MSADLYLRSDTDKGETSPDLRLRSDTDKVPAAPTAATPHSLRRRKVTKRLRITKRKR